MRLNRRQFIGAGSATGVALGFNIAGCDVVSSTAVDELGRFAPSPWLRIGTDNVITIFVSESEMGQGVFTALPTLIAEELAVSVADVRIEPAPVDPAFGRQETSGSSSIRQAYLPLREIGARAKAMLITAAAARWSVPATELVATSGSIRHTPSDRHATYGELALAAAALPIPQAVSLKAAESFTQIGKSIPRTDVPDKVRVRVRYGIDVQLPGMLTARLALPPSFGATVADIDSEAALAIEGVEHVVDLNNAVAVVARGFWAAEKGLRALRVTWDREQAVTLSSREIDEQLRAGLAGTGLVIRDNRLATPPVDIGETVTAEYSLAFQAHATMEPMNCTASVSKGECDVWAPTQGPGKASELAAELTLNSVEQLMERIKRKLVGEGLDKVRVHTLSSAFPDRSNNN